MKPAESDVELVRFHKKNLGILKPSHPAYLDVSTKVVPMLDHIILTFVYVESLRQEQAGSRSNLNNINNVNNINNGNNTIMMNNATMM
ncbi:hypothetical protein J3R82DRAFT_4941 [Butyriboletus roseoflavus]|nr:hypothetical protein J3R82DRAFT_5050 [Butyriboletus roseoflavus]KAG8219171.1 hypothetical protein J3R82DRAFT_4941 [Butyriboletus roseoflavus]